MHQAEQDLLVLAAQNGNQRAFSLICQHYHKLLLRYAYNICSDKEIAQDATQEAWIKFSRNIHKLNDPRALRTWLYRLVRWCSIDLMREAERYHANIRELDDEDYGDKHEEISDKNEALRLAIKRLPIVEKQIIHLFYLDGLKINEIAAVLGIPVGTVKSRLNRARKLLATKFGDN